MGTGDESDGWSDWEEKTIMDESLRPPTHVATAAMTTPPWVLLECDAYIATNHGNATTATSRTRSGHPIEVSFWAAPPPRVSYMCVHCPGLDPHKFAAEPTIIATEADLVLLRLALGPRDDSFKTSRQDYFIYHASSTAPKLSLIPPPVLLDNRFIDKQVGILRCLDDGTYIVAALCSAFKRGDLDYVLHLYRSGADAWTCHPLSIHGLVFDPSFSHVTSKVITVGGEAGTMGWVDINDGILFCDLLRDTAELRYLPLPPPLEHKDDMIVGCPGPLRDFALVQGRIKYIEMQVHVRPGSTINGTYASQGWVAATWSAPPTNPWKQGWRHDCQISASHLAVDHNTMNFELLPKLGTPQQTLERLHVGLPKLSLHSDDIVCFMAKVDLWDDQNAWVLAVDMKNKRLKDVAEFGAGRTLGISSAYISTRISDYLPTAPGLKGNLKRRGVMLTVPSHKKQTRVVLSNPSWKGGDQQNSGTSMDDKEDNMDLDLDMFFG
ncbi:uncharacterized protein LOC127783852 [Oryza glaberrima]|uniref:DUF1618 domain-containing protein n=1 Tax=Oryza barthii TaxID=65489 RepID=A0A0D3HA58_9ORYZ|nr:uncharacterized protein LOC127783852 [Oryza glaberrima]